MLAMVLRFLSGGVISRILETVDRQADNETERKRIANDLIKAQVNAEVERRKVTAEVTKADPWLRYERALFIFPTGIYYGAIIADSLFHFEWNVAALPAPYDMWGAAITSAVFVADGIVAVKRRT